MRTYADQLVLAHFDGFDTLVIAVVCDADNGAFRGASPNLESLSLDPTEDAPSGPGLWVWQGTVSYFPEGDPETGEFDGYSVECEGSWRPANGLDMARFGLPALVVCGSEEFRP